MSTNKKERKDKMKVNEIISIINELKENDVNDEIKLFWMNEVECRIKADIFKKKHEEIKTIVSLSDDLSAPSPYSRLYVLYLCAMIEFGKGNYDSYYTIIVEFEKVFSEYAKYIIRSR